MARARVEARDQNFSIKGVGGLPEALRRAAAITTFRMLLMPSRLTACCTLRTGAALPKKGELASFTDIADMPTSADRMRVSTLMEGSSRWASNITSLTMAGQAGMRMLARTSSSSAWEGAWSKVSVFMAMGACNAGF